MSRGLYLVWGSGWVCGRGWGFDSGVGVRVLVVLGLGQCARLFFDSGCASSSSIATVYLLELCYVMNLI